MLHFLNPMRWLLKAEGYPPAVLFSVGLHALVVYLMWDHDFMPRDMVDLDRPEYVRAAVVQENPQKLRRIENERRVAEQAADARRREQEAAAQRQREEDARRQAEAEAAAQERARLDREREQRELAQQQERERQAEEQRRQQAEAQARAEQERAAREAAERQAALEAQQRAAAEAQATAENQAIADYRSRIYTTLINSWNIPPSARNGMTVRVRLNLVPTGEIINYQVTETSGNAAFDQSVIQAIEYVDRFPELQDMPSRLFETNFRTVYLTFSPEDLLR